MTEFDIAPAADVIEAKAAEWLIARLHDKDWNDEKEGRLEAWLSEAIAHEVAYLRLEAGWNGADKLAALKTPATSATFLSTPPSTTTKFHAVAVLLLCAAFGATAYVMSRPSHEQIFATPVGGRETITLVDGSQIELNTNSEIRLPKGSRQATLVRGEAYFQIKHDPRHPFTLDAGDHRVVDLGTKFVVRQTAANLEVTLVEGLARVESASGIANSKSATLDPGDVAIATRDSLTVTHKPAAAVADALSWRSGFVTFHHTTLLEAASELNRYNAEQIVLAGDGAANRIFGGKFRTTDSRRFAAVVGAALGLHVEHHGTEIVISVK